MSVTRAYGTPDHLTLDYPHADGTPPPVAGAPYYASSQRLAMSNFGTVIVVRDDYQAVLLAPADESGTRLDVTFAPAFPGAVSACWGIAARGGLWTALVSAIDPTEGATRRALTVQVAQTDRPLLPTDWTIERTLLPPGAPPSGLAGLLGTPSAALVEDSDGRSSTVALGLSGCSALFADGSVVPLGDTVRAVPGPAPGTYVLSCDASGVIDLLDTAAPAGHLVLAVLTVTARPYEAWHHLAGYLLTDAADAPVAIGGFPGAVLPTPITSGTFDHPDVLVGCANVDTVPWYLRTDDLGPLAAPLYGTDPLCRLTLAVESDHDLPGTTVMFGLDRRGAFLFAGATLTASAHVGTDGISTNTNAPLVATYGTGAPTLAAAWRQARFPDGTGLVPAADPDAPPILAPQYDSGGLLSRLYLAGAGRQLRLADGSLAALGNLTLSLPGGGGAGVYKVYRQSDGTVAAAHTVPDGAVVLALATIADRPGAAWDRLAGSVVVDGSGTPVAPSSWPGISLVATETMTLTGVAAGSGSDYHDVTFHGLYADDASLFLNTGALGALSLPSAAADPQCALVLFLYADYTVTHGGDAHPRINLSLLAETLIWTGRGDPVLPVVLPWPAGWAGVDSTSAITNWRGMWEAGPPISRRFGVATYGPGFPSCTVTPVLAGDPIVLGIGNGAERLDPVTFRFRTDGIVLAAASPAGPWQWWSAADTALLPSDFSTSLGLYADPATGGDGSYAPGGTILPVRFSGTEDGPAWAAGAVIWKDGSREAGYLGCCGDGATGAYALTTDGDLVHAVSPGAAWSVIVAGAIPGGDTVLDMQRKRHLNADHTEGGAAAVHGNGGMARLSVWTPGTPWSAAHGDPFAWPTEQSLTVSTAEDGTSTFAFAFTCAASNA